MNPRLPILILWTLTTLTAAQPQCDPLTQYEKGGECCSMCGPGTYMTSLGKCLEPQCHACEWNEYQESYTKEPKCHLQPYCDPNVFFQVPTHDNKKKTTCLCQDGYHCATKRCSVCIKHMSCQPGHAVKSEGTHDHDTVCEKCPPRTYSDGSSAFRQCKPWTECEPLETLQQGTNTSDNICGLTPRWRLGLIAFAVIPIGLVIFLAVWFCRDKSGKISFKKCPENPPGLNEPLKNTPSLVLVHVVKDEPEDPLPRTPEENVHEPSQELFESMSDVGLTEKGQCVVQENGKAELLSRQESQTTQTFSSA